MSGKEALKPVGKQNLPQVCWALFWAAELFSEGEVHIQHRHISDYIFCKSARTQKEDIYGEKLSSRKPTHIWIVKIGIFQRGKTYIRRKFLKFSLCLNSHRSPGLSETPHLPLPPNDRRTHSQDYHTVSTTNYITIYLFFIKNHVKDRKMAILTLQKRALFTWTHAGIRGSNETLWILCYCVILEK